MRATRRTLLSLVASGLTIGGGCLEGADAETTTVPVAQEKRLIIRNGSFSPGSIEVAKTRDVRLIFENRDDREYVLRSPVFQAALKVPPLETFQTRVTVPGEAGIYEICCEQTGATLELKALPKHVVGDCGCGVSQLNSSD